MTNSFVISKIPYSLILFEKKGRVGAPEDKSILEDVLRVPALVLERVVQLRVYRVLQVLDVGNQLVLQCQETEHRLDSTRSCYCVTEVTLLSVQDRLSSGKRRVKVLHDILRAHFTELLKRFDRFSAGPERVKTVSLAVVACDRASSVAVHSVHL